MATNAGPEAPGEPVPGPSAPLSGQPLVIVGQTVRPRKLSEDLALIVQEFKVENVTLREVLAVLHGGGFVLLILLLALPFSTPIPLPGLSTPFGLVIALIALRLSLGQKPWLPARLLDTRLSPKLFSKVFAAAHRILRVFELFLRPRLPWLTASGAMRQLHAVPILVNAILLLLPLPVPFSNLLPALSVLLLCAGLLEKDGVFILAGHVVFLLSLGFFGGLAFAGAEGFEAIKQWFFGAKG